MNEKFTYLFVLFIMLFPADLYPVDDGSSEVEYSFGDITFTDLSENINEESFLYLSHNYLYYVKNYYISFRSRLGVSKNLLFQNSEGLSYKNIVTGIIPGIKYKYLKGVFGIIPEIFTGISINIISLWNEKDENNLIFFTGINIGSGISYKISDGFRIGLKFMYDIGYGNFMTKRISRFTALIKTFMLTLDFYED